MENQRGFTLIELSVVTFLITILLGFITISLIGSQQKASLASIEEILLADLKQQQLKSMVGDTEGRPTSDSYGIHFDPHRYVLFYGTTYSSSDTSNSIINLDDNTQFNDSGYDVVFSRLSGTTSAAIIELQNNISSNLRRIHLSTLGVITQIESL